MIHFNDWEIVADCEVIARQYDNLTRSITIDGDIPSEWNWELSVEAGENREYFDVLPLAPIDGGIGIVLTEEMLSVSGTYIMQLYGTRGEEKKHTNRIFVYIPPSLSGNSHWPAIPSEFSELEKRMQALANTYPTIGDNGNWVIADKDTGVSAKGLTPFIGDNGNWWIGDEDTGVPASGGGHGNVFSNDVSAIRVLTRAEYDAIEKHDETVLYLITG